MPPLAPIPTPLLPSDADARSARAVAVWQDRLSPWLEVSSEGVFGVDRGGRCSFINAAAARMLGYLPHEVMGRNIHALTQHARPDGTHCPVDACPIFQAFRAGVPCRIDNEVLRRRDGSALSVAYTAHPVLDGAEVLGAVVTFVAIDPRQAWDEPLDAQGLWATLAEQVQDFIDRSALRCEWSIDIDPGLPAPQGMHATAIFSIFEEMLGNVARHAQATEVLIRVRATPGDLTLLVKDNGKGAPPSAFERTDAHGVKGMRERAGHHGGWLQIDSQPGQGTQVILSMPLDHAVLHEERAA